MFQQFDVIVIVIILISSLLSFLRGFIKEFLTLIGWIGAAAITLTLFPFAVSILDELFRSSIVINVVAITIVFLTILAFISLLNAMILDNLREFRLGSIDRSMGILYGMLRGFIVAAVLHFSVTLLHDAEPDWLENGETYALTKWGADVIKKYSDKYVKEYVDDFEDDEDEDFLDEEDDESFFNKPKIQNKTKDFFQKENTPDDFFEGDDDF